jgi:ribonucleoside-diphosphate reductase alpha chain
VGRGLELLIVGDNLLDRLKVPETDRTKKGFDLLNFLGFSRQQISEANDIIAGRQTVEGAPGLKPQHLAVFDCANRCGPYGKRFIEPHGHVRMMAAVQLCPSPGMYAVTSMPLVRRTRATLRRAELGFLGVAV